MYRETLAKSHAKHQSRKFRSRNRVPLTMARLPCGFIRILMVAQETAVVAKATKHMVRTLQVNPTFGWSL